MVGRILTSLARLCLAVGILMLTDVAGARDASSAGTGPSEGGAEETGKLDALFAELKREADEAEAKRIARRIWDEWNHSGSATVDVLMQWANEAIRDRRFSTALDLLDQVIVLAPDYAEGWNRRATVHYLLGNHAKSMSDINRVLQLEPRHFGALSGMGAILLAAGNERMALRAFQRSLEIYPADTGTQQRVIELEEELAGDPI